MATNREHQVRHMTGFPRSMYPFTFNSMRSHSPFDLLASSHLFGRFGADLPKEMAALWGVSEPQWGFLPEFIPLERAKEKEEVRLSRTQTDWCGSPAVDSHYDNTFKQE
ncbi:unnamed protein product [Pleuronectes platessa]|uniref:Uncharacterized protein n=1 Tax=Pleuronectes platessa TaxID=8262 RepID=A0A9N7Z8K1_PLEPL|nr:unnamed protein product [Pleuronectes platessa]